VNAALRWFVVVLALLGAAFALTPEQEARVQQLGSTLRCPVCRGLPLTESPNDLSEQMLREVRRQVEQGRTNDEIYAYFAARYGAEVLLEPPRRGVTLALWVLPVVVFAAGAVVLTRFLRRASSSGAPAEAPATDEAYVQRVQRDLHGDAREVRE